MYRIYIVFMFALLQKMCTKKITVGSFAVRCIDEVKAKNVLPFSSTVIDENSAKNVRILQCLALHTYVLSLPKDSSEAFQQTCQTSRLKSR